MENVKQSKLDIGKNLKTIRKSKYFSQTIVAKGIGIQQSNYCDIEQNKTIPTIPTLQKLADFFGVSLSDLLKEDISEVVAFVKDTTSDAYENILIRLENLEKKLEGLENKSVE